MKYLEKEENNKFQSKLIRLSKSKENRPVYAAGLILFSSVAFAHATPLKIEAGRFVDEKGGDIVLRGFNLSNRVKTPPFITNEDPDLFVKLSKLGVNVVRHQFNWEAYETQPGVYDESYLDHYAEVTARAQASNIYVYVDIHQDGFSRWSLNGCGEGFPNWVIPEGFKQHTPDNGPNCLNWVISIGLQQPEQIALFDSLFTPGTLGYERYMALMEKLAVKFSDAPNVIGYDLINEPHFSSPKKIVAFYQEAALRIQAIDPDAMIFIEPQALVGIGVSSKLTPTGIANVVYAPHYYDLLPPALTGIPFHFKKSMTRHRQFARDENAALMLGEFGASPGYLTPNYIDAIYDGFDKSGDSANQWSYTPEWNPQDLDGWNREDISVIDDNGQLRSNFRARPYARRTAGQYGKWESILHSYVLGEWKSYSMKYTWQHAPEKGATDIFVPTSFFEGREQPEINTSPSSVKCVWITETWLVRCTAESLTPITVTIR